MNPEDIMLSEISPIQNDKHLFLLYEEPKTNSETESKIQVWQGQGAFRFGTMKQKADSDGSSAWSVGLALLGCTLCSG